MGVPANFRSRTCLMLMLVLLSSRRVESFAQSGKSRELASTLRSTQKQRQDRSFPRYYSRIPISLRTASTETEIAELYNPNQITPETKSITGSMAFYARFVIQALVANKLKKSKSQVLKKQRGARRKSFFENLAKLNEQRKNLVTLAGYNSRIVIPSFSFLFLGALMTSIVPLYESKCIQLVATLHPSRAKVVEALVGLVLSSTLASLFTGLRGSLFWLAGRFWLACLRRLLIFLHIYLPNTI